MKEEQHFGEMMTVPEVADYLHLNEKMIYRLVREGRLPGTKVTGKWTFPRHLIRQWMEAHALKDITGHPAGPALDSVTDLFIAGSNDLLLDHLISVLLRVHAPKTMVYFANTGSMGGLRTLALGKAHAAGLHLFSPETGAYNTPFVQNLLPGRKTLLFNLAYRKQGLISRRSEAGGIKGIGDLASGDLRLVNREEGSGTRHLLDLHLEEAGIDGHRIPGYHREVSTHLEVGLEILREEADVGLGIEPVAALLGLDFLPLTRERFDLAVPVEFLDTPPVAALINLLQSREMRDEVKHLPGYGLEEMGRIVQ
jgi:excisionase family DNA binding protein